MTGEIPSLECGHALSGGEKGGGIRRGREREYREGRKKRGRNVSEGKRKGEREREKK